MPSHPTTGIQRVVILEEDLEVAPDFFSYFEAVALLLDQDPRLLAASAWNDNGMAERVRDPAAIYRSDFFPGLGWMLTRQIWAELGPKWPEAYWDDWLRDPEQRKGRHFLRPEICRTYHFGKVGTSGGQFAEYWERVRLNKDPIDFTAIDLSHLASEQAYDRWLSDELASGRPTTLAEIVRVVRDGWSLPLTRNGAAFVLSYDSYGQFLKIVRALDLFPDRDVEARLGVSRTAYKGVVTVRVSGAKVHIARREALKYFEASGT